MPIVGQLMIYFGWPFASLPSVVSVVRLRAFDRWCVTAESHPAVFANGFSADWMGIATVLNVTIAAPLFGLYVVPFWLLIVVTNVAGGRAEVKPAQADTGLCSVD